MQITLNETTAAERRTAFYCEDDAAGFPLLGQSFVNADLKVGKTIAETDSANAAAVVELGGGWYRYEYTAGEVNTLGGLTLRVAKTGIKPYVALDQVV